MAPPDGEVTFGFEEMIGIIEDLVRVADALFAGGDEVNAFLVDLVVNQLLGRAVGGE